MSVKGELKETATFWWWVIAWIVAGSFVSGALYFGYYHLNPAYEQVRYNTFKQSQAYNDGMVMQLSNFQVRWATANDTEKAAIRAAVTQQFGAYDRSKLPSYLQDFYNEATR